LLNKLLLQLNKIIEFDEQKCLRTLSERGLDFFRAGEVFAQAAANIEDICAQYGEKRYITFGFLDKRLTVLVRTKRGAKKRIISMRGANEREIKKYIP
jgi:uncharacterized protein